MTTAALPSKHAALPLAARPVERCHWCKAKVRLVLDLGAQPLANGLLDSPDAPALCYPLRVAACRACGQVQLGDALPPPALFGSYVYRTGVSATMRRHFHALARELQQELPGGGLVYDIGSNDGTLLRALETHGLRAAGVDPSSVAADVPGTHHAFFTPRLARRLRDEAGPADAVVIANCLAHTPEPAQLIRAAQDLLQVGGWLVLEFPYWPDTVQRLGYSQVYHEHYSYLSAGPLWPTLAGCGFSPQRVERLTVHDGSLRLWCQRESDHCDGAGFSAEWSACVETERAHPIDWEQFAAGVAAHRAELQEACREKRVAGITAPAKATVMTNWTGVRPEVVYDETPDKIGRWLPQADGRHIPIRGWNEIDPDSADLFLVYAANFFTEIAAKLPHLRGKLLCPLPSPTGGGELPPP